MTKGAALHEFFNRLQGMPAYPETDVPRGAGFPRMTYSVPVGAWGGGEEALTISMWFKTESEAIPNAKAQELSELIGAGGVMLPCDGGAIWVKRGAPWCQSLTDESDSTLKRRYINVSVEYITLN